MYRALLFMSIFLSCLWQVSATVEMSKQAKKNCTHCHRVEDGGTRENPQLKPVGIKYLISIVRDQAYIPLGNHQQLIPFKAKIEENKQKKHSSVVSSDPTSSSGPVENKSVSVFSVVSSDPTSSSGPVENKSVSVLDSKPEEAGKEQAPAPQAVSDQENGKSSLSSLPVEAEIKKTVAEKNPEKKEGKPQGRKGIQKKIAQEDTKAITFKGGNKFVLQRKPQSKNNYDWEDDWEFDDYF